MRWVALGVFLFLFGTAQFAFSYNSESLTDGENFRSLPWTDYASASESATSESSARYSTDYQLRWRIDQKRLACDRDEGQFSSYPGLITCSKWGSTYYRCTQNATVYCRE